MLNVRTEALASAERLKMSAPASVQESSRDLLSSGRKIFQGFGFTECRAETVSVSCRHPESFKARL